MLEINQRLPLEDAAVYIGTLDRGDVPLLETLHQHVSSNSLYYRYFCSYRPTLAELHHMCRQDDKGALWPREQRHRGRLSLIRKEKNSDKLLFDGRDSRSSV